LVAKFWFEADQLDENNWVVDFGGLKELKKKLQDQFDHTTCVSKEDPKLSLFKQLDDTGICDLRVMDGVGIEMFAEWCYKTANEHVKRITNSRCRCIKAEVFEHEQNSAIYENTTISNLNDTQKQIHQATPLDTSNFTEQVQKNLSKPPFAGKKGAAVGNKKQINKWVDTDANKNTWGL
jgi:6-pyruvoyltetrahydropterin/6-carboxytetrahydropterin synthase